MQNQNKLRIMKTNEEKNEDKLSKWKMNQGLWRLMKINEDKRR